MNEESNNVLRRAEPRIELSATVKALLRNKTGVVQKEEDINDLDQNDKTSLDQETLKSLKPVTQEEVPSQLDCVMMTQSHALLAGEKSNSSCCCVC